MNLSAEELLLPIRRVLSKQAQSVVAPDELPEGSIDAETFRTIEVQRLFDLINDCKTLAGQTVLYHAFARPSIEGQAIRAKQAALEELRTDADLRQRISEVLGQAAKREVHFYRLLLGRFIGVIGAPKEAMEFSGFGYEAYSRGRRFFLRLIDAADDLPTPRSPYLRELIKGLRQVRATRAYALLRGPVFRVAGRVVSGAERTGLTPAVWFRPTLFKPLILALIFFCMWVLVRLTPTILDVAFVLWPLVTIMGLPLLIIYVPAVGEFDRERFIYPLRDTYKGSPEVMSVLESLGRLDELLCYLRFYEEFGSHCVVPEICDSRRHLMALSGVRNPLLAWQQPGYVSNDIQLQEQRLTFITGANSGGKTALCKTIAQVQLLAQAGCYVPALEARMGVADRIFYQAPATSLLDDAEGRFGTELRRTKRIFFATSPNSLVILDELSEGTTFEERMEISQAILDGFLGLGNSTILVTHNHALAEYYRVGGVGQFLQVRFDGDLPSYRLQQGISRISRADAVAKKIGFTRKDIERHIRQVAKQADDAVIDNAPQSQ